MFYLVESRDFLSFLAFFVFSAPLSSSSVERKIFTSWDESNGSSNNKVSRLYTNCFRNLRDLKNRGSILSFAAVFCVGVKKKYVKWIYVISFFLSTNIVHVHITDSSSHTDNYVYFSFKKAEGKENTDFAQFRHSTRERRFSFLDTRTTAEKKGTKKGKIAVGEIHFTNIFE